MYRSAINILKKIDSLGYEAYIIGGFTRDYLLGKTNNDIDICTNTPINIIKNSFNIVKDNSVFGSFVIEENNYLFEITIFRKDLEYKGRYPKIEYSNSLEEDIKRRDFTINTICIDKDENIIDLMGARDDLNNKIIRCIGNIELRLKEDPLRILRAIRFMGELNFSLEKNLESYIIKLGYLLKELNYSQINKELNKMNNASLTLLKKYDLEKYIKR